MAATEPKITKLKPGEGAGSFKRKQAPEKSSKGRESMRSRTPKGQRRTQNPAILSDGSVDPRSKQYQRGVAGREKLEDYVKRLDAQGADERDIFMAAVNSLKNRGHGYVGAYLDSKNPSRRYNDVQAKAIADAVMSKADVGSHPGARLTKPDGDDREAQADRRAASKESGSAPEPGRKAMSVRQQRKQPGGRNKDSLGMPETWAKGDTGVELTTPEARERERTGWKDFDPAVSDISRPELSKKSQQQQEQRGKKREKGSKEDQGPETAAQRFQKSLKQEPQPTQAQGKQIDELLAKREEMEPEEFEQAFKQLMEAVRTGEGGQREALRQYIDGIKGKGSRAPLPGSAAAAARDKSIEKEQAAGKEQQELRQKQAQAGREKAEERRQAQKEAEADRRVEEEIPTDTGVPAPERQKYDPDKWKRGIRDYFVEQIQAQINSNTPINPDDMVELTAELLAETEKYKGLTTEQVGSIIKPLFNNRFIDGFKMVFKKDYKPAEGQREPEQEIQGPKTATEQPAPAEQAQQQTPPPEETQTPARKKLDAERLSAGGSLPEQRGGGGFTIQAKNQAKNTIQQLVKQGETPKQAVEKFKQLNIFGKTGFDTDTDSEPIPTESPDEFNPSSDLPGSSQPAESPGQKSFLSKAKGKETTILPSAIQIPEPAEGVNNAKSYTAQLKKADIPTNLIEKAVKKKYPPKPKSKRNKINNSSEYQQFSDAVRQVVRLRSKQYTTT